MSDVETEGSHQIVLLYHRSMDLPYHGASLSCKRFVERVRVTAPVAFVGPSSRTNKLSGGETASSARLAALGDLATATLAGLRFILYDAKDSPSLRTKVVIAFDVYVAGFAALWARIRGLRFVYYPQDSNRQVSQDWVRAHIRGAWWYTAMRKPMDYLARLVADMVIAPSEKIRTELVRSGVAEDRVMVCTSKAREPVFDPEAVRECKQELGLDSHTGVIFVGSFKYLPNIRGFDFIRTFLAPRFLESNPAVKFLIIGEHSDALDTGGLENILVLRPRPDLDSLLFACSIGVAPMDIRGGTSSKIIDYVLHGLTVVATPEASQGVAPSKAMTVVKQDRFAEALERAINQLQDTGHLDGPRLPDPRYLELYCGMSDVDDLAKRMSQWIASSR